MKLLNMDKTNFLYAILIVALLSIILCSCVDGTTQTTKKVGEAKQRIIGKEYTMYQSIGYQIIEIDGVEYVCMDGGGICPLVK